MCDELNESSVKLAAVLMNLTSPFLVKDVLVDWQITVHHDCVYIWNFDGVLIASVDEAGSVQCLVCDPVHVNDALKETVAWLKEGESQ